MQHRNIEENRLLVPDQGKGILVWRRGFKGWLPKAGVAPSYESPANPWALEAIEWIFPEQWFEELGEERRAVVEEVFHSFSKKWIEAKERVENSRWPPSKSFEAGESPISP